MQGEKVVGGIACSEVLARLSDYVDGRLAPNERASIDAHLRGCSNCERFGGTFGAAIGALREQLGEDGAVDDALSRLRARLRESGG